MPHTSGWYTIVIFIFLSLSLSQQFASPTGGYMLKSSGFPLLNWDIFYKFPLEWSVIFLQSPTLTGYSSNSTGSSVTNCRFFPIIAALSLSNPPRFTQYQWLGKNRSSVTDELVEFGGITSWSSRRQGNNPSLLEESIEYTSKKSRKNQKITTYNQPDSETLGNYAQDPCQALHENATSCSY